jgi:hypothetical protein
MNPLFENLSRRSFGKLLATAAAALWIPDRPQLIFPTKKTQLDPIYTARENEEWFKRWRIRFVGRDEKKRRILSQPFFPSELKTPILPDPDTPSLMGIEFRRPIYLEHAEVWTPESKLVCENFAADIYYQPGELINLFWPTHETMLHYR